VLFGYEVLAEIFLGSNQVKIVMQGIVFGSLVNAALSYIKRYEKSALKMRAELSQHFQR
jgi:hypothetical protein